MFMLAAGSPPATAGSSAPGKFALAHEAARNNQKTPEGKLYDDALGVFSREKDTKAMDACVRAAVGPDLRSFNLVAKAAVDGVVTEAMVHPETNVSTCFRDRWKARKLPQPPRADYWVLFEMTVGR
jgi:hypothetical protein